MNDTPATKTEQFLKKLVVYMIPTLLVTANQEPGRSAR